MENNKLTREELILLVQKICETDYETEEEGNELIERLEKNVIHPSPLDVIRNNYPVLNFSQILDKIFSYQPIITPPPKKD
jgi:hypothetical protein